MPLPPTQASSGVRVQPARIVAHTCRLPRANWLIRLVDMSVEEIGAFEAKTRLSELLERVSRGQVYRITKRGRPIAELRPIEGAAGRPRFGSDRGRVVIAEDFDAPLGEMQDYTR